MRILDNDSWGYCLHCFRKWNKVKRKTIYYQKDEHGNNTAGMFPICEECFENLSVEQISDYIKILVLGEWRKWDDSKSYEQFIIEIKNAINEVIRMKNENLIKCWNELWGENGKTT